MLFFLSFRAWRDEFQAPPPKFTPVEVLLLIAPDTFSFPCTVFPASPTAGRAAPDARRVDLGNPRLLRDLVGLKGDSAAAPNISQHLQ